jgi:paired amphipathic helix protein Sin3a
MLDGPSVEPTLTPVMPEPIGPTPQSLASAEEFAFFDRVKKHIGNRAVTNEFIKLLNLYVMDLITKEVLVHKASQFIGGNAELIKWLKDFVKFNGGDQVIENRPKPPTGRVSLSNCRGYGPSYRLLPRRVSEIRSWRLASLHPALTELDRSGSSLAVVVTSSATPS